MVSATKLCLFISKGIIGVLALGAWVVAVIGLARLHDVCKDHYKSTICESGLRSQWWTVCLQAVVLGGVGVLWFKSWLKRWRFPVVGLLAMVSMRLMADIQLGLNAQQDQTRLNQLDKEFHTSFVAFYANFYRYYYSFEDWDYNPEKERVLWEAITQGHKFLAQSTMASLQAYGDLKAFSFGMYIGGLIILSIVNLLLLMSIGTDEKLSDYEPHFVKWVEAGSSRNDRAHDQNRMRPRGKQEEPHLGSTSQPPQML